jgi:hypothetical protein
MGIRCLFADANYIGSPVADFIFPFGHDFAPASMRVYAPLADATLFKRRRG